jgi:hypothetical protein
MSLSIQIVRILLTCWSGSVRYRCRCEDERDCILHHWEVQVANAIACQKGIQMHVFLSWIRGENMTVEDLYIHLSREQHILDCFGMQFSFLFGSLHLHVCRCTYMYVHTHMFSVSHTDSCCSSCNDWLFICKIQKAKTRWCHCWEDRWATHTT